MSVRMFDAEPVDPVDRMWPLDVATGALAGLILYLTLSVLEFDDPRWLHNAYTYVIAVPLIALAFGLVLRRYVSRHLQKSAQLGFLFSVFVHLLLMILAVRWMIFPHYFPEVFAGVKQERSPVRKTISEHHFQTTKANSSPAEWEQPVEAEAVSRETPDRDPASEREPEPPSTPELELPAMEQEVVAPVSTKVPDRRAISSTLPELSESAAPRERKPAAVNTPQAGSGPVAPDVAMSRAGRPEASATERSATVRRRQAIESASVALDASTPSPPNVESTLSGPASLRLQSARSVPAVASTTGRQRLARNRPDVERFKPTVPVGATPSAPSVAVAKSVRAAARTLVPDATRLVLPKRAAGRSSVAAVVPSLELPRPAAGETPQPRAVRRSATGSDSADRSTADGGPSIVGGATRRARRPARSRDAGFGLIAAAKPTTVPVASSVPVAAETVDTEQPIDRSAGFGDGRGEGRSSRTAESEIAAGVQLDGGLSALPGKLGGIGGPPIGIGPPKKVAAASVGNAPEIGRSLKSQPRRRKRKIGPLVKAAGSVVSAVESFDRRMKRTEGGSSPTPSGMVGPATEEAIERGLAFLAAHQNTDGSWSLQGHGKEVAFRSDSAATGLCLLAFQGAGYTHKRHQYAETVSKGIAFLKRVQSPEGSLYRKENPMSDRSVAFYSHGIAALAMCEAYGMTQDEALRPVAQKAVDYICKTQHRLLGGWRYSPQGGADTSVSGWMMMALKSGELSGLTVPEEAYSGIERWLGYAQKGPDAQDRYRYNPFAPNTEAQRHGRLPTPTMTAVGMLMRMYGGWSREQPAMQSAADYLLEYPPEVGSVVSPQRDTYYWYYATQVMFHMGGDHWERWNRRLNPILISSQITDGPQTGSWDPSLPVPDRWGYHGGRLYVTTTNLLNLEVYYRHLPIYEDTAYDDTAGASTAGGNTVERRDAGDGGSRLGE